MHKYSLKSGKGFIYTLDAIVAITLVTAIILTFNLSFNTETNASSIILRTISGDLINVMNENKIFYDIDKVIIDTEVQKVLPKNYKFSYKIKTKDGVIESGDQKDEEDYYSGYGIINTRSGLSIITYNIWQKE